MSKCPHGIYIPSADSGPDSIYCSGCQDELGPLSGKRPSLEEDGDEPEIKPCPACQQPLSSDPDDEFSDHCTVCGFDSGQD